MDTLELQRMSESLSNETVDLIKDYLLAMDSLSMDDISSGLEFIEKLNEKVRELQKGFSEAENALLERTDFLIRARNILRINELADNVYYRERNLDGEYTLRKAKVVGDYTYSPYFGRDMFSVYLDPESGEGLTLVTDMCNISIDLPIVKEKELNLYGLLSSRQLECVDRILALDYSARHRDNTSIEARFSHAFASCFKHRTTFNDPVDISGGILFTAEKFARNTVIREGFPEDKVNDVIRDLSPAPSEIAYYPSTNDELMAIISDDSISLSSIDTGKIEDFSCLFQKSTRHDYSGIETWDVSRGRDFSFMFDEADFFNEDISGWDTSNAETMEGMFRKAIFFDNPLGNWNVGKCRVFSSMFEGARSFNQDIGGWDMGNAVFLSAMFKGADRFNQPIGDWNLAKVEDMSEMFYEAMMFNQDISKWKVPETANTYNILERAKSFKFDAFDGMMKLLIGIVVLEGVFLLITPT